MPSLKDGWLKSLVEKNCVCCPYGYHIDRDFVNFSKKMLCRDGDVERLEELREKCRKEQNTMVNLLGIPISTFPHSEFNSFYKGLPQLPVSRPKREKEDATMFRRAVFDASVQVDPSDLSGREGSFQPVPILQIIEKADAFSQADPIPQLAKKMRSFGISATPRMTETSVWAKPTVVNSSTSTDRTWKAQTRNFGVTVSFPSTPTVETEEDLRKDMRTYGTNTEKTRLTNVGVGTKAPKGRSIETQTELRKTNNIEVQTTNQISFNEVSSQTTFEVKDEERGLSIAKDNQDDKYYVGQGEFKPSRSSNSKTNSTTPSSLHGSTRPSGGNKRAWSPVNKPGPKPWRWGTSESPEPDTTPKSSGSRIPRLNLQRRTSPLAPNEGEVPYEQQAKETRSGSSNNKRHFEKNPTRPPFHRSNTYTVEKEEDETSVRSGDSSFHRPAMDVLVEEEAFEEETRRENAAFRFFQTPPPREKVLPSKEMQSAMKVLNDAINVGKVNENVSAAVSLIMRQWFSVCGTSQADPNVVEDYIDYMECISDSLLRYIINMPDGNGNTVLHYSVSHGNFDVVSVILNSNACNPNKSNKAGYTPLMLVALAKMNALSHKNVVRRLFELGDVNIKATQHGQTALMLAASHGRIDTVKQLIEADAEVDIQDEDGSTALMCATEHGHGDIVKFLLDHSNCDPHLTDNDGTNALGVAMEAGHKDIGVMIYAHMYFKQGGKLMRVEDGEASPRSTMMDVNEATATEPTPPQKLSPQEDEKTGEPNGETSA